MIVSREQSRSELVERREAIGWLGRQLAWERVLTRLRESAGVLPGAPARTGAQGQADGRCAA